MADLFNYEIPPTKHHRMLVEAAYLWVLKNGSCGVAFKELNSLACNGEYPDVIGFGSHGYSVLIECKTTRSDFHSDKKKVFRQHPEFGMGSHRYYCCPTGVIKKEDLPEGWGLIYVNEKYRARCVYKPIIEVVLNEYGDKHKTIYKHEKNLKAEHGLMYSALRRLHIRGRIDEIYNAELANDDKRKA